MTGNHPDRVPLQHIPGCGQVDEAGYDSPGGIDTETIQDTLLVKPFLNNEGQKNSMK